MIFVLGLVVLVGLTLWLPRPFGHLYMLLGIGSALLGVLGLFDSDSLTALFAKLVLGASLVFFLAASASFWYAKRKERPKLDDSGQPSPLPTARVVQYSGGEPSLARHPHGSGDQLTRL